MGEKKSHSLDYATGFPWNSFRKLFNKKSVQLNKVSVSTGGKISTGSSAFDPATGDRMTIRRVRLLRIQHMEAGSRATSALLGNKA